MPKKLDKDEILHLAEHNGPLALRLCGKALEPEVPEAKDRIAFLHKVYEKVEAEAEVTVDHYRSLLEVYKELGFRYKPEFMLARIKNARIQPDSATYHLLLEGYLEDGNAESALQLVQVRL